jgi:ABC-type nitrate/sulfonate/bicarbonate transport system substrate-binding protein
MQIFPEFIRAARAVLVVCMVIGLTGAAEAAPPTLRVGFGVAVEEPLWLMIGRPDLAPNEGKVYQIESTRFSGADKRIQAFEAGALDIAVASANGALFAAAEGIDFRIIGSMAQESPRGFVTQFMVKDDSPVKSPKDLKGMKIGINGFSGSGHLWVHTVLGKYGLTESDVTLVPLSFSVMDDAVRSGMIDVGMFPQPFAAATEAKGGLRKVFTSKDAAPYDEELTLLIAKPEFLAKNTELVKAFMSDLSATTHYYVAHPQAARQALIDAKMVRIPAEVYVNMTDYYRDPDDHVSIESLKKMQDLQVSAGFQKQRADIDKLVDLSFLPN